MKEKYSYFEVLKELDRLRAKGVKDSDPEVKKLKAQLWVHLEKRKKDKSNKIVPKITAVKTLQIGPESKPSLGDADINTEIVKVDPEKKEQPYAKYFYLGAVAAIIIVIYRLLNRD